MHLGYQLPKYQTLKPSGTASGASISMMVHLETNKENTVFPMVEDCMQSR